MANKGKEEHPIQVDAVLDWEKKHVHRRRRELGEQILSLRRNLGAAPAESKEEEAGAAALCLSGGGIRSASISLGFLQACDRLALLKKFDYLFTVSGGGYIGGWLTALIHRLKKHDEPIVGIDEDHGALNPKELGAEAVANLRRYSNYLTPRLGLFSGDSLALVAIYLRNLILNGLILLSLVGAATVLPKIVYRLFASDSFKSMWASQLMFLVSGCLALVAGGYTVYASTGSKRSKPAVIPPNEKTKLDDAPSEFKTLQDPLSTDSFVLWKVTPLLLSLLMLSGFAYRSIGQNAKELENFGWIGLWCGSACALGLFFWGWARRLWPRPDKDDQSGKTICNIVQILGAYAIGAIAFLQISKFHPPQDPPNPQNALLFLICIPPGLLTIYLLGVALFAGFVNPILGDDDREWWARSSGYLLFAAALWLIVATMSLCVEIFPSLSGWYLPGVGGKISGINWTSATTGISGLLALLTRDSHVVSPGDDKGISKIIGSIVFAIACPVFIAALVLSLSIAESLIGQHMAHAGRFYVGLFIGLILIAVMLSFVVNVNRFSLHNTYRNRLIRTFLGASHRDRKPNPFTGFDEDDNVFFNEIVPEQRPYHVVCGTVNLYAGANLAWQERRATLFTFSRDHCGCDYLDYRPTAKFGGPKGITLGTAMAISGAAANPNMGFYTAPDRAFVMTLLNVRLGWWLGNPRFRKPWRREGPFPALWPLISEMLLLTRESSNFINVSDGGHFDDTAVYEAVRRRCSTIFLVDANTTHENVARMIRKVRIDFGVDITLQHDFCDSGIPGRLYLIQYPESKNDPVKRSGVLLRVYPALEPFKNELPADVLDFAKGDPDFPSDQIVNQWYGEAQFESYRKLGREIGMRLFAHKTVRPIINAL
jgi:hypothetical protein